MAKLNQEEIRLRWEKPRNSSQIARVALDNQRQSFHAKLAFDVNDTNGYYNILLERVRLMLNNTDKFRKFKSLFTFPLPSNHLISKGSDEWNKIFKTQDRVEEFNFVDDSLYQDFQAYLERKNFTSFVEQSIFNRVKQSVNTIAVVDIQEVDRDDPYTEPTVYMVDTGNCKDISADSAGKIEYVMFERGNYADENRQLVVIDDVSYQVFGIDNGEIISSLIDVDHNLGFCPATFCWRDVIDTDNTIRRFNSVAEIVDDFDEYVIGSVFAKHIDLYASFPILWMYQNACDTDDLPLDANGNPTPPEVPYLGPGWQMDIQMPEGENVRMAPPVGFIEPNTKSLDYNKRKLKDLEVKIIKHLTGVDNEISDEKAFNESQIKSQYETRTAILKYWAENLQFVHNFLINTIGKLRYGDQFISATIDYGTDYFLYDEVTATTDYEKAKAAGLPMFIVASRRKVVQQIQTRNSPREKSRFGVLEQLEPYIDMNLADLDKLTPEYELKANFSSYIDRFELENGDIITFGSKIDFRKKIENIKVKLYDYVKETRDFQQKNSRQGTDLRQPGQGSGASDLGGAGQ